MWTPALDARLRALWDAGLTSAVIGERLACSRDAVLGRVRRLGLRPRLNPSRRADDETRSGGGR
jgi:GcrA cell cycle regulator